MKKSKPLPKTRTMAIVLGTAFAAFLLISPAQAISRVETSNKSCAAIKSILQSQGAAILRYPSKVDPSRTLYDRYVANRLSCQMGQVTERSTVPTADTPSCRVERCVWADPEDDFLFRPKFMN